MSKAALERWVATGEDQKKKGVVNAKHGQEIEIKSDSLPFGFAILRSLMTLMRTEGRGARSCQQLME